MHREFWSGISKGRDSLGNFGEDRNRSDIKVGRQGVECCLRLVSGEDSFEYITHKAKRLSTSLEPTCSSQIVNLTSHSVDFQKVPRRGKLRILFRLLCKMYAVRSSLPVDTAAESLGARHPASARMPSRLHATSCSHLSIRLYIYLMADY